MNILSRALDFLTYSFAFAMVACVALVILAMMAGLTLLAWHWSPIFGIVSILGWGALLNAFYKLAGTF